MRTKNFLLAFMLSAFTITSCNKDDELGKGKDANSFSFTSSIADLQSGQTRASGTKWDKNDAIGIYMKKDGTELSPGAIHAANKHHIVAEESTDGLFVPANAEETVYYPEDNSKVDFIAYYPYKKEISADYLYPIDVAVQTSQPDIDFLYSNNATGVDKSTPNIGLKFEHKLTKIVFAVTSRDISDLSGLTIAIKGIKTKASYNLNGGTTPLSIDENSTADIQAVVSSTGTDGEAIILPENGADGRTFVFTLPTGDSYTWKIPADKKYEKGTKYTYEVDLSSNKTMSIVLKETQISKWLEAPSETIVPQKSEEDSPVSGKVEVDKLYGYGEGTTGGEGGTVYHFDNGAKFRDWLSLREKNKSTEPVVVWLSGTFTKADGRSSSSPWFDIKRTSNISIYGTSGFKMQNVGFFLNEAKNIIIRNVYIVMPKADNGADGISMQKSEKVWVDHCTFESVNQSYDYEDGSCDITHGTKNVTVSWNHFIKTQKTSLVGHSDSETADVQITATYHHNFFDQSSSRHPRVRYGKVHVYNNFYNKVTTYGVGSAYSAKVLVENNFFEGVHLPTDICTYPAKGTISNLTGKVAGFLFADNNEYADIPSNASNPYPFTNVEYLSYQGEKLAQPLTYADFKPAYNYIVDDQKEINSIVPASAGAGKLARFANAPIPVDNANMPESGETPSDPNEEEGIDIPGGWATINMGADGAAGVTTIGDNGSTITLSGKGKFESGKQTFNFVYKEITGDFEITACVESFTVGSTSNQAEAGLILVADINKSLTDLLFALSGKGGDKKCNYAHRLTTGANSAKGGISTTTSEGGEYLKLRRVGNTYYASYSLDGGASYSKEKSGVFTEGLPEKLYVGLIVNSGSATDLGTAKFSYIKINGESVIFTDGE